MKQLFLFLALATLFLFVPASRMVSVFGSSEAREIHVASQITESGDWLLPKRLSLPPSKPPLYHWVVASIAEIFHQPVSPALARMVNVLAAMTIVWLTILLGQALGIIASYQSASLCLLIFFLSHFFFANALDAKVDMFFSAMLMASIFFWVTNQKLFAMIFLGASVLTKGPIGLVLMSMFLFTEKGGWKKSSILIRGAVLLGGAIFGLWWYGALVFYGDSSTLERQLVFENLQRLIGGEHINAQPVWFYMTDGLVGLLPISVFFILSFFFSSRLHHATHQLQRFCLVVIIFFSIASGKRVSYLLPLVPFLALIAGDLGNALWHRFSDRVQGNLLSTANGISQYGVMGLVIIAGVVQLSVIPFSFLDSPSTHIALVWLEQHRNTLSCIALLGGALVVLFRHNRALSLSATVATVWCVVVGGAMGIKGALRDFDRASARILEVAQSENITVVKERKDELFDPILLKIRRQTQLATTAPDQGYLLMRSADGRGFTHCHEVETFRQIPDQVRNNTERSISLFYCQRTAPTKPV